MFFAGSVISSITSGLSNSFTCTERMSLKSWIENLVIHVAKLSKMEEGVGRLGMEFGGGGGKTTEGGLVLQNQRGAHKMGPGW